MVAEQLSWEELQQFWWIRRLHDCPQHPEHHGEGDVGRHLKLVLEHLRGMPEYRALPDSDRLLVWNAALLHDVAKPDCTREDFSARGHSRRGAILAREILWRLDAPVFQREQVAALVAHHMVPFWLLEQEDPRRRLLPLSLVTRCDLLAILARADALGRISASVPRLLEAVELFREYCAEQLPARFPDAHTRLHYCRSGGDPERPVYFAPRCRVTVLAGLPGAGKDGWISRHCPALPQVSLDQWRERLKVDPRDHQAPVLEAARTQARELLRQSRDFVWNATNLSRDIRERCLSLFLDYQAEIRLVHLEVPAGELYRRNRERAQSPPPAVLDRLLTRWEYPHPGEAHELVTVNS